MCHDDKPATFAHHTGNEPGATARARHIRFDTIRYDTIGLRYEMFDVRSKAVKN